MEQLSIRPEEPDDAADVRAVNEAAFGRAAEAELVERLRGRLGAGCISLVATRGGAVIGHALFSPVCVERRDGAPSPPEASWALGPMAVEPPQQRWGAGRALVEAGIAACRARGGEALFVLGHPSYYPRFGFARARPRGFTCAWEVPDDVFLVLALRDGALEGRGGHVVYPPEFAEV